MFRSALLSIILGVSVLATYGCRTNTPTPGSIAPPVVGRPSVQAPFAKVTPLVTAEADDPAWANASVVNGFTLAKGSKSTDRPLPTEVRLLWDKEWLYIRFTSTGPEPYAPFGTTRDALHYQGDVVEVFIDPTGDGRQYFEIQQSPAGGILDQNTTVTADPKFDADGRLVAEILARNYWPNRSYDMPGLRNASKIVQRGDQFVWTADFAFPAAEVLKRLGKKQFEPMPLRANLIRYHATDKVGTPGWRLIAMNWSPVKFGCPHQSPAAMGTLELIPQTR